MREEFVPNSFKVPNQIRTERFKLRMLKISDLVKDFDAVITSKEYLLKTKPFGPNQTWPSHLTLEQNLIDLGWHQKEFQRRTSFAYTIMDTNERICLGCVYIFPSTNADYDAGVIFWVRESEVSKGLDSEIYKMLKEWLNRSWPFTSIAFPGRDHSWEEWEV